MSFFADIAKPLAEQGVPVVPLRERTKIAFLPGWEEKATTDLAQIGQWDQEYPNANCACVAFAKLGGRCFVEFDSPAAVERCERETGQKLPQTFIVSSSPGKFHYHFKQTAESLAMGNIAQGSVPGGDWSARIDRQYVVAPGSIHPTTGLPYEIVCAAPAIDFPAWLVAWCLSQRKEAKKAQAVAPEEILLGSRNTQLASMAGTLRSAGLSRDGLLIALLSYNLEKCVPPLPESEVETIANSIARYETEGPRSVVVGNKIISNGQIIGHTEPVQVIEVPQPQILPVELPYPKFPVDAFKGTSIYEGFAKPWSDKNSRPPEFMLMPALLLQLNWLSTRVTIKHKNYPLSLYLLLMGAPSSGKSSCIGDACDYFSHMNYHVLWGPNLRNAEGRIMTLSPGSAEGIGLQMQRTSCKNAVGSWDELMLLVAKVGIDTSALRAQLLSLYEGQNFTNGIKSLKDGFSLERGSYVFSAMMGCTTETFSEYWGLLAGGSTGISDRFLIVMEPEFAKPDSEYIYVNTYEAAQTTKRLMDMAASQREWAFDDTSAFTAAMQSKELDRRTILRGEKIAFGLAVDLGYSSITDECVDRALDICRYDDATKKYLTAPAPRTPEARLACLMVDVCQRAPGCRVEYQEYRAKTKESEWGPSFWSRTYDAVLKAGYIRQNTEHGQQVVHLHNPPKRTAVVG